MNEQHKQKSEYIFTHLSIMLAEHPAVVPTYIMIIDGDLVPVVVPHKEISMEEYEYFVHEAAKQSKPEAMIFICEQWMVSRRKDDPQAQLLIDGVIRAQDQKDKEPYLSLIYKHADGNTNSLIAKIESDPVGTRFTRDQTWIENCESTMIRSWI